MGIKPLNLTPIRDDIFMTLARTFPVTSASDEFPEFPQVLQPTPQWDRWDSFSEDRIESLARQFAQWEDQLDAQVDTKLDIQIDTNQLIDILRNLREHLTIIRRWERQPTFYLTIAAVGMAEALSNEDPAAPHERAKGLPAFFDQATQNLKEVPSLFNHLGLEMAVGIRRYFQQLIPTIQNLVPALDALKRFETYLQKQSTRRGFHLPPERFERLIQYHLNTGMDVDTVAASLDAEISETKQLLSRITARRFKGASLEEAYNQIPLPEMGPDGLLGLYRNQINHSTTYLINKNILSSSQVEACPVSVQPVPDYLSATRSASSYSIPPGHPPAKGTFYVINADDPSEATRRYQREYRILTAHETYPGHHLLDGSRWRHKNPIRQVIEHPVFYEGWACFSEELMFRIGYLRGHEDLLMLIRRRLWRALRGKVDLGLQTGAMTIETAAQTLSQTGLALLQARRVVRKYALNPGYQVCYTVGYQQFRKLFDAYGRGRLPQFVQAVISQGEIQFKDLATVLKASLA